MGDPVRPAAAGGGKKVVVAGAGIIGLCVAYYCAKRGHRVVVVDRNAPARDGCSFGNAGMVVPSHFTPLAAPGMVALGLRWMWNPRSPFYIKPRLNGELLRWGLRFARSATRAHVERSAPILRDLSLASRKAFEELSQLPGVEFGLVKKGLLMLCRTPEALEEESHGAEKARDLGIPAEVLDSAQTAKLEPGVRMGIAGSVYYPQDCHLSPGRLMAALAGLAEAAGVRFAWETEVRGWNHSGGVVRSMDTDRGTFSGDEYVVCGGSWSPAVARGLGVDLPMQAGKGYSLTLPRPRQSPAICSIFTEARVAVTPMDGGLRFGGTMEIAGMDESVNRVRVEGIVNAAPKYYPDFQTSDFANLPVWRGLRPCSPDGMPYVGRFASLQNVVAATGHAMMGLSLGPVTGQLVADLVSDQTPAHDIRLLAPDRFN